MINKYKPGEKELKEYKAKFVKQGTAKNDSTYTMFQISDAKKGEDGNYAYDTYMVFSWQQKPEVLKLQDGDKITFEDIKALEVKEDEYNGKKSLKKTIFADINVIPATPNKVDVVEEGLPNLDDLDPNTLPF